MEILQAQTNQPPHRSLPGAATRILVAVIALGTLANGLGLRGAEADFPALGAVQGLSMLVSVVGTMLLVLVTPALLVVELGRAANAPASACRWTHAAGLAVLMTFASAVATPPVDNVKARNAGVMANANTVRLGLEQYATEHEGQYPPTARWQAALCTKGSGYLPDDALPRSPWSRQHRVQGLAASALKLPTAAQIAAGTPLPAINTPLDADAGTLYYDMDSQTQTYVLYGVGRRNHQTILAAAVSNQ